MENPRRLLCIRVRQNDVEISSTKHILSSVINAIYYTIIDYIEMYRKDENVTMSYLEKEYYLDDEFINCENPELYLYENRELHDKGLIIYVYDNFQRIESKKHRRMMFYFMNILYFDL